VGSGAGGLFPTSHVLVAPRVPAGSAPPSGTCHAAAAQPPLGPCTPASRCFRSRRGPPPPPSEAGRASLASSRRARRLRGRTLSVCARLCARGRGGPAGPPRAACTPRRSPPPPGCARCRRRLRGVRGPGTTNCGHRRAPSTAPLACAVSLAGRARHLRMHGARRPQAHRGSPPPHEGGRGVVAGQAPGHATPVLAGELVFKTFFVQV
jgi:hypothetical protein